MSCFPHFKNEKMVPMQAIILAAGMGKRLGKLTESDTKCMLEVNGIKLIDRAIESIEQAGITKLCIVIGYKGERVRDYLGSKKGSVEITYIVNSDYSKTNNIYSLLLASDFLKSDSTVLLESDLIFEPEVISELVKDSRENIVLVDKFQSWMDGTVISFDKQGIVREFLSKKQQNDIQIQNYYKTVNIYKFSAKFSAETYVPFLNSYCKSVGLNEYYESVLSTIANLQQENLFAKEISPYIWHEIDDVIDHANAETMFAMPDSLYKGYSQRFGGYWRFPKIKDYCYLVNPYFPTKRFKDVLQEEFSTLLSEYPSGLNVIESMAANQFKVDPKKITVGNGASELIGALSESLPKSNVGYFNPGFDEYAVRFAQHNLFATSAFGFTEEEIVKSLIEMSEKCDFVVFVNPDNPTGRFLNPEILIKLLPTFKSNNCNLILDESFVDFSALLKAGTLLKEECLQEFENLIIIKSISKSYGVAGVRLGVLATGNVPLLKVIRQKIPVWNVNSFAEKFLQKISHFEDEYWESCKKLSQTRTDFERDLTDIGVKVWPSSANFLMIQLEEEFDSSNFCNYMIKNNFLIKNLKGKIGMPEGNFYRIAIKSKVDNDLFIGVVQEYKTTLIQGLQ